MRRAVIETFRGFSFQSPAADPPRCTIIATVSAKAVLSFPTSTRHAAADVAQRLHQRASHEAQVEAD